MKQSKIIADCGMMTAVSVVIMILGSVLGLGMYASPMIVGLCLIPIGNKYGKKYHILSWVAVSILCFILIANVEQNLMFLCFFGCYPILWPYFQRIPKSIRLVVKLLYFNVLIIALEMLIMLVLVPEIMGKWMLAGLLALGNITFLCYDFIIPRAETVIAKYTKKLKEGTRNDS